jgi:uncharacterized protein related to proFAR isomerase
MEIIPLINLKKGKMVEPKYLENVSLNELLERFKGDKLYILDHDGIEKNKPNLCLYQKLSKHHELWVDAGIQVLGDVVDSVIAGASSITIRRNLWRDADISGIKEIFENKIYAEVALKKYDSQRAITSLVYDVDGLVVFDKKNQIEGDFKSAERLKGICKRYETYAYELKKKNVSYWKKLGVTGLLIDIEKVEEFKRDEF